MNVFGRYLAAIFLGVAATAAGAAETVRFAGFSEPTAVVGAPRLAAATARGELLYENHCTSCHASIVHIRENRKAKSLAELRDWVGRWSAELKLNWSNEEVEAVAEYLASRFYKFGDKA